MRTAGPCIQDRTLADLVPGELSDLENPQTAIPRIAKDRRLVGEIESAVRRAPTHHDLYCRDGRDLSFVPQAGVQLIVTSPPYWTLKQYRDCAGQLGHVDDYAEFMDALAKVWREAFRVLVPGGRLVIVVGDVCLSRRKNAGRHTVVPLHAGIQESCRSIGFDNLAAIIWYKIANAAYEVQNGSGGFLGKPYEPNAVIKNDFEYVLMQRRPGGYRKPSVPARVLSVISAENHGVWFRSIWSDITGASTRNHPAPYPVELAERLVRMFSFVGDTVLDPFWGTGSTSLAAAKWGRHSIGVEIDPDYFEQGRRRLADETADLFGSTTIEVHEPAGVRGE